jgi:hypothetical protein
MFPRALVPGLLLLSFFPMKGIAIGQIVESRHFIVQDMTGSLSASRVNAMANAAEGALKQILDFWSADPRINDFGKIRLELDKPRAGIYGSVFVWGKVEGRRTRIVKVFGIEESPQMMFHKIAHAVFPNEDKLIRNMMGIPMEVKFGNLQTFPMCGHSNDGWVLAYRRVNSYIPLEELGPNHEQWGMSTKGGLPVVVNQARQHITYAESGSLGMYLLNTYGVEKVKTFNRLSHQRGRSWEEVFGLSLQDLEKKWIQFLESHQKEEEEKIASLVQLLRRDPEGVCPQRGSGKPSKPRRK